MIEVLKQALEVIETAIKAGDWKVDGACDPDNVIHGLRQTIAEAEKQSHSMMNMPHDQMVAMAYGYPPQSKPLTDEEKLSNGFAMALHDAMLIRIGKDDEATRQAITRIDKLVAKYTNEAAHGIKE